MKRSPLHLIASLILVLSFALASCAPAAAPTIVATQPPAAAETIMVIFPKHEADLNSAFEARIREFEKQSGIKVELIQSNWDSVANRMLPEISTGGSIRGLTAGAIK